MPGALGTAAEMQGTHLPATTQPLVSVFMAGLWVPNPALPHLVPPSDEATAEDAAASNDNGLEAGIAAAEKPQVASRVFNASMAGMDMIPAVDEPSLLASSGLNARGDAISPEPSLSSSVMESQWQGSPSVGSSQVSVPGNGIPGMNAQDATTVLAIANDGTIRVWRLLSSGLHPLTLRAAKGNEVAAGSQLLPSEAKAQHGAASDVEVRFQLLVEARLPDIPQPLPPSASEADVSGAAVWAQRLRSVPLCGFISSLNPLERPTHALEGSKAPWGHSRRKLLMFAGMSCFGCEVHGTARRPLKWDGLSIDDENESSESKLTWGSGEEEKEGGAQGLPVISSVRRSRRPFHFDVFKLHR